MNLVAYRQNSNQSLYSDLVEDPIISDPQFLGSKWIRSESLPPSALRIDIGPEELLNGVEDDPLFPGIVAVQVLIRTWDKSDVEPHIPMILFRHPNGKVPRLLFSPRITTELSGDRRRRAEGASRRFAHPRRQGGSFYSIAEASPPISSLDASKPRVVQCIVKA